MVQQNPIQVEMPPELFAELQRKAQQMGLSVPAYVAMLQRKVDGKLSHRTEAAMRFVFSKHRDSLRKLAE